MLERSLLSPTRTGEGWQGGLFIQLLFAYSEEYSNFIGTGRGNRTPFIPLTAEGKDHIYEPDILVYYFFDEGEGKQHPFQILSIPYARMRNTRPFGAASVN